MSLHGRNICCIPCSLSSIFHLKLFPPNRLRSLTALHVLLTHKTQTIYLRLFFLIWARAQTEGFIINWTTTMSDFETGLLPALRHQFPLITIHGCHFHYCKAVLDWLRFHGFMVIYKFIIILH